MTWNRLARTIAAAALAAAGIAATTAGAAAAPPPAADTGAMCAQVPDGYGDFDDIGASGNVANIECLAAAGITAGVPGGGYDPSGTVTRAQMASFVARLLDTVAELSNGSAALRSLPAGGEDAFTDDDGSQPHEDSIDRLAAAGIVSGSGDGLFRPSVPVNRAQMATFINNAHRFLTGAALTSTTDFFADDDGIEPHEANINGIAAAGIAQGSTDGTYGPGAPVTRSQMASFLIRHLAVLLGEGVIDPLPGPEEPPVAGPQVDGSLSGAFSCTWTQATTSASPPQDLAIDASSASAAGVDSCTSDNATGDLVIHTDMGVTFDDAAATATVDEIDATVVTDDGTCRYRATGLVLDRDGDTRGYFGQQTFTLSSGDPACPASDDLLVTLTFR